MDREKFRAIYQKFAEADKNYHDYIEQFFTRILNGEVVKEAAKILNHEGLEKIKELREEVKKTKKEVDKFLRGPNK